MVGYTPMRSSLVEGMVSFPKKSKTIKTGYKEVEKANHLIRLIGSPGPGVKLIHFAHPKTFDVKNN